MVLWLGCVPYWEGTGQFRDPILTVFTVTLNPIIYINPRLFAGPPRRRHPAEDDFNHADGKLACMRWFRLGLGFGLWGSGLRVQNSGFRVYRVEGSEFRV